MLTPVQPLDIAALRTAAQRRRDALGYDSHISEVQTQDIVSLRAAADAWATDRAIVALAEAYRDAVAECNGIAAAEAALFAALAAREGRNNDDQPA